MQSIGNEFIPGTPLVFTYNLACIVVSVSVADR